MSSGRMADMVGEMLRVGGGAVEAGSPADDQSCCAGRRFARRVELGSAPGLIVIALGRGG